MSGLSAAYFEIPFVRQPPPPSPAAQKIISDSVFYTVSIPAKRGGAVQKFFLKIGYPRSL
jgi:hypothetical protein